MDLPYYHGPLTKQECEALLFKEEVDGNFLIRDSESLPGVLCLCVSFKHLVYVYRIFSVQHGYEIQTKEGHPKQIFPNLRELISNYKKPDQGLVVHLSNPIERTSCPSSRMQSELNDIYENSNQEYVDVLP
uniref:SH2 domain-containing protein 1B n=1 Tax=Jaculus jaculus TaxID=51337 RepID=UPI001E1AFC92|nr:SH2 domain-containing protein 1B [Jaculus jaculus]